MNQKFDITNLIEKLKKEYRRLMKKAVKTYLLKYLKESEYTLAKRDKDGKWVRHSDPLRQSSLNALGYSIVLMRS
jgi:hypothetical protein